MKKFTSTLRLSKTPDDALQPATSPVSPGSLKRSNARLRKRNKSSLSIERPDDAVDWDFSMPVDNSSDPDFHPPPLFRQNSWDLDPLEGFPSLQIPACSPRQPEVRLSSSSDVSDRDPMSGKPVHSHKAFSKLFSKMRSKQKRVSAPDNFTKWDSETQVGRYGLPIHPSNINPEETDNLRSTTIYNMPQPSSPRAREAWVHGNPFNEAHLAQQKWANRSNRSSSGGGVLLPTDVDNHLDEPEPQRQRWKGKGKRQAIRDLDWSYISEDDLAMIVESFKDAGGSPADSGLGLLEEDDPLVRSSPLSSDPSMILADQKSEFGDVDQILAEKAALEEEMRRTARVWQEKIVKLSFQQEALLDRQRQEEEDRQRAKELQDEEDRKAAERARLRGCVCCGDDKEPLEFPARPATSGCEHNSSTCIECMEQWMATEFEQKGADDLKCPECTEKLSYDDVQRCAKEETFTAYEKILTRNALASLPEFSWCLGPNCTSGQLNEENQNFMDCAGCGYKQCLQHKVPWHTGETCEAYTYRTSGQKARDEEAATEAMINEVSKKCPGTGCGWRIQKTEGCDHMKCKKCKHEFCWECLASHREIKRVGNTAHESWCKFHSDNLETSWPFNVHA